MNNVIPFAFNDSLVRAVQRDGEPWFVGKDICAVLEISKHHQALERLHSDERGTCSVGTPHGDQSMIVVSEPGVYRLVFTSRKPEAEEFKRWLAHEVLPALRKNGFYGEKPEAEPRIGEEPIAVLNVKLAMIREARMIFGLGRARELWQALGLPAVPVAEVHADEADAEALACLRHLLKQRIAGQTYTKGRDEAPDFDLSLAQFIQRALDGDEDSRWDLMRYGVRVEEHEEGDAFWIASYAEQLAKIYRDTRWADVWRYALKRLPGAKGTGNYKVDGQATRGVRIPADYLERIVTAIQ